MGRKRKQHEPIAFSFEKILTTIADKDKPRKHEKRNVRHGIIERSSKHENIKLAE